MIVIWTYIANIDIGELYNPFKYPNPRCTISAPFYTLKISVRSQNWCLTIPKLVPDNPKTDAWRSQKCCLTTIGHHFWDHFWDLKYDAWRWVVANWGLLKNEYQQTPQPVVRHHILDLRNDPRNGAWRLSGTIFVTVSHQFWDCQAPVLGSSGTSFGISRLFFGV